MTLCKCGKPAHPCYGGYRCEDCFVNCQTHSKSSRLSDKSPGGKRWVSNGETVERTGTKDFDELPEGTSGDA